MATWGGRGGWAAVAAAVLGVVGPAAAQSQPTSVPVPTIPELAAPSAPTAGPGSLGWPQPVLPPTTPLLETPPSGLVAPPVDTLSAAPLPGSLEEQLAQEYDARKLFRYCTWNGVTLTAMPRDLLWQPPFAIKREPRMVLLPTTLDNYRDNWTLDTSIGATVGMWRADLPGHDLSFQFDIAAVVHTRLTPDDLTAHDYRFAFPLTARWGPWHAKLAYEHTSAHIGDELIRAQRLVDIPGMSRDEIVVGVGRWLWNQLRVYGQVAYGARLAYSTGFTEKFRYRFDYGFEWYHPGPTGWAGTPFAALNLDHRGDRNFDANVTAQVGWLWRNPYERLANIRLFGEYYTGVSPYGVFFQTKESFFAVGLSCDY